MKQLLQDLRTGNVDLAEVPRPLVRPGHLLIATERSLIFTSPSGCSWSLAVRQGEAVAGSGAQTREDYQEPLTRKRAR